MGAHVRRRVKKMIPVPGVQFVRAVKHDESLFLVKIAACRCKDI
jgi:hypothetical protein